MRTTTTIFHPLLAHLQQRREDYRLDIPAEDEVFCTFTLVRKGEGQSYAVTLEVRDISAGGLSVADYDKQLGDVIGATVNACELTLPNHNRPLCVDVKVLRAQQEPLSSRYPVTKVSAQFVHLSDDVSVVIRRYISEVERRQIAQQRGLN